MRFFTISADDLRHPSQTYRLVHINLDQIIEIQCYGDPALGGRIILGAHGGYDLSKAGLDRLLKELELK